jgi:hypothetical protein
MSKHAACALVLGLCTLPVLAQTESVSAAPAAAQVDQLPDAPAQVVVEGRRPGPGVWKVSRGDHVLWIFGLYSPLPKKLEWDDSRVERLVKNSQELLLPPHFAASVGVKGAFSMLLALPSLAGIENNPDGAMLRDVVPADTYARWSVLKARYIGNNDEVEKLRPAYAADRLLKAGLDRHGLAGSDQVFARIAAIAKQYKVKQTFTGVKIELADPKQTIRDFKAMKMEDQACFARTLDSLEGDIDAMLVRANAWADGNMAEIRTLDFAERDAACGAATVNNPAMLKAAGIDDLAARVRANWLASAEEALAKNASTFALLRMRDALHPDGVVAALQAKGYTVESPRN